MDSMQDIDPNNIFVFDPVLVSRTSMLNYFSENTYESESQLHFRI